MHDGATVLSGMISFMQERERERERVWNKNSAINSLTVRERYIEERGESYTEIERERERAMLVFLKFAFAHSLCLFLRLQVHCAHRDDVPARALCPRPLSCVPRCL